MKTLIVYYSYRGNTRRIAEMLREELDCDIARIEPITPYSEDYDEVVELGRDEVKRGYTPEIKPLDFDVEDYDAVIIGTPTWWYTMAPAVLTFLRNNDFSGKTVIPFQTHGGWKGHALRDMKKECKGARIAHEKDIRFDSEGGNELVTPIGQIREWIGAIRAEL